MAALAAVVVLVAELGARALSPALPPPSAWRDGFLQAKAGQVEALGEAGGADVVIAGTSQMAYGLDPELFARTAGLDGAVYNAGVWDGSPSVNERWLLDVVVPALRPDTVVLGFSTADFAPKAVESLRFYEEAPEGRRDLLGRIDRWLSDRSALVRHRTELRRPGTVWRSAQRRARGEPAPPTEWDESLQADGYAPSFQRQRFTVSGYERGRIAAKLTGFEIAEREIAALHRLVEALRRAGTEVVLVNMPISYDYIALHPHGGADVQRFREAFRALAAELSVPLIDLQAPFGDAHHFADLDHLNGPGGRAFSTLLGRAVAGLEPGAMAAALLAAPPEVPGPAELAAVAGLDPLTAPLVEDPAELATGRAGTIATDDDPSSITGTVPVAEPVPPARRRESPGGSGGPAVAELPGVELPEPTVPAPPTLPAPPGDVPPGGLPPTTVAPLTTPDPAVVLPGD